MKTPVLVLIVGLVAVVIGVAFYVSTSEVVRPPETREPTVGASGHPVSSPRMAASSEDATEEAIEPPPADGPQPVCVVDQAEFEFGMMTTVAEMSHDFLFTNKGTYVLKLKAGKSTCKCTIADMPENTIREVAPGESVKVTLSWKPKAEEPFFRQSAPIFTNDRNNPRVEISVSGQVSSPVRVIPAAASFPSQLSTEAGEAKVHVLCVAETELRITDWTVSDTNVADFVTASWELMSPEEVQMYGSGMEGKCWIVTVGLKPGLPLGPFKSRIVFLTDNRQVPEIIVPLSGKIVSEVLISGPKFDSQRDSVDLGRVSRETGKTHRLSLMIKGEKRNEIEVEVAEVTPEWLNVTVDEGGKQTLGRAVNLPIVIEVPKDSPISSFIGTRADPSGEVVLKTNHPLAPEIRFRVRFAVDG